MEFWRLRLLSCSEIFESVHRATRLSQHEKVTVQISSKISIPEKMPSSTVAAAAAEEEKENSKEPRAPVDNVSDDTSKTVAHPTNQRSDPAKDNHNKTVTVTILTIGRVGGGRRGEGEGEGGDRLEAFNGNRRTFFLLPFLGNQLEAFLGNHARSSSRKWSLFLGKITAELFPGNDLSGSFFFFVTNGLNAYLFSFAGSEVNAS